MVELGTWISLFWCTGLMCLVLAWLQFTNIKNVNIKILRFNFGYDHHDYIKIVKITLQLASKNILAYSFVCTILFIVMYPNTVTCYYAILVMSVHV